MGSHFRAESLNVRMEVENKYSPLVWKRVLALVLDLLPILIIGDFLITSLDGYLFDNISEEAMQHFWTKSDVFLCFTSISIIPFSWGFSAVYIAYRFVFEASPWQATPGKKLLGLKLESSKDGELKIHQLLGRSLLHALIPLGIYLGFHLPYKEFYPVAFELAVLSFPFLIIMQQLYFIAVCKRPFYDQWTKTKVVQA